MGSKPVSLISYLLLIRDNTNFRRLWCAQIVSEIGDWFYTLSIYSLLLELTGRAESVALAVVLQVLPLTFIGPMAGVINDRLSRKRVMIASDLARALIVLGMMLVRTAETAWLIYPLLLLETVGYAFFEPARSSVIPNVTPPEDMIVANTLSSTTWSFNLAIGSTLGGLVAAVAGRDVVFILNTLSFLTSAWFIGRMKFTEPHLAEAPPFRARDLANFAPILEGIRYIRGGRRLVATVFVKGGLGFMGVNLVLLPILGERVFPVRLDGLDERRAGMLGMSLLMGARGVGALLAPLIAAAWAGRSEARLRNGILLGFLMASTGYMLLGTAEAIWFACLCVAWAHGGGSTVWVFSTTLLQIYTDDRYRGRVFSAELGFHMLAISIFSYLGGRAIDWGIPPGMYATLAGASFLIPALAWIVALRWFDRR